MRPRHLFPLPAALAASIVLVGNVLAGGWANAILDAPPNQPTAGQPVQVGFMLLQHGVTPVTSGTVEVIATDADGARVAFAAHPQGAAGHWVATVTFPHEGNWTWKVDMPNGLMVGAQNFSAVSVTGSANGPAAADLAPIAGAGIAAMALLLTLLAWWIRRRPRPALAGHPEGEHRPAGA